MFYQFIENVSRRLMEWAIRKQKLIRPITSQVSDVISYRAPLKNYLRDSKLRKALS